ncbi:MAG: AAA family ATPase [Anaerovoracaceae bacterium]|jgi:RecA-family ATPase
MDKQYDLIKILEHIDPSSLSYSDWCLVGMALNHEGLTAADWDEWSKRDRVRYKQGECFRKWESFNGTANPVTAGTIVQLAKDQGWRPEKDPGHDLDWDDVIGTKEDFVVINRDWVEGIDIIEPNDWDPAGELIKYLEILFEASESVGYVTQSWEKDGRFLPSKGDWSRSAGKLIEELSKCKGDVGAVLGDYNPMAGAWIRFNPLDGNGIKNENVTDYRYALVESDDLELEKQNAIIRELELPIACLVYSGNKSIHAIVKVEAADYAEYRKRVDYLYTVCQKNGLKIDTQNKNPSRLSRMPGILRNGNKQFLIDTNIGKESWKEWYEWIESVNDDLPEPENMESVWDNLPELSPPLIDGILRQGHKMLLAGPSKAGKSYALIELCCAIAEGGMWLGWNCAQGRILYVNLELDRASCLHRFKDVYNALRWSPNNLHNIDVWNLRGKSVPMDKLAPRLIRRAQKKNYIAIIIDPIYKVITGDENSADQMAHFCNQFDLVCSEVGSAVIYCHHHSKGSQGSKRSMDRASGSGVFARDPDVLLDLIELEINDDLLKQEENKAACAVCIEWLDRYHKTWEDYVSQDDMCSENAMLKACDMYLLGEQHNGLQEAIRAAKKAVQSRTAWRIEGTLREFPKFPPVNLWFDYPVHNMDIIGSLKDIEAEGEAPPWKRNLTKKKSPEEHKKEKENALETAYEACSINEQITIKDIAEYMGVTEKTVRNRIKEHEGFRINNGKVEKK